MNPMPDPETAEPESDPETQPPAEPDVEPGAEVPETESEPSTETITDGYFEEELHVDAEAAGAFLVELGEQLQAGDEIELAGEGWRIPFRFREPIELEIEFQGEEESELEIEVELKGGSQDEPPEMA